MENEELKEAFKKAYSIENMAAHGKDYLEVSKVGSLIENNREYIFYKDSEGGYWYYTNLCPELERISRRTGKNPARNYRFPTGSATK